MSVSRSSAVMNSAKGSPGYTAMTIPQKDWSLNNHTPEVPGAGRG